MGRARNCLRAVEEWRRRADGGGKAARTVAAVIGAVRAAPAACRRVSALGLPGAPPVEFHLFPCENKDEVLTVSP